jgi:hypothetical protein
MLRGGLVASSDALRLRIQFSSRISGLVHSLPMDLVWGYGMTRQGINSIMPAIGRAFQGARRIVTGSRVASADPVDGLGRTAREVIGTDISGGAPRSTAPVDVGAPTSSDYAELGIQPSHGGIVLNPLRIREGYQTRLRQLASEIDASRPREFAARVRVLEGAYRRVSELAIARGYGDPATAVPEPTAVDGTPPQASSFMTAPRLRAFWLVDLPPGSTRAQAGERIAEIRSLVRDALGGARSALESAERAESAIQRRISIVRGRTSGAHAETLRDLETELSSASTRTGTARLRLRLLESANAEIDASEQVITEYYSRASSRGAVAAETVAHGEAPARDAAFEILEVRAGETLEAIVERQVRLRAEVPNQGPAGFGTPEMADFFNSAEGTTLLRNWRQSRITQLDSALFTLRTYFARLETTLGLRNTDLRAPGYLTPDAPTSVVGRVIEAVGRPFRGAPATPRGRTRAARTAPRGSTISIEDHYNMLNLSPEASVEAVTRNYLLRMRALSERSGETNAEAIATDRYAEARFQGAYRAIMRSRGLPETLPELSTALPELPAVESAPPAPTARPAEAPVAEPVIPRARDLSLDYGALRVRAEATTDAVRARYIEMMQNPSTTGFMRGRIGEAYQAIMEARGVDPSLPEVPVVEAVRDATPAPPPARAVDLTLDYQALRLRSNASTEAIRERYLEIRANSRTTEFARERATEAYRRIMESRGEDPLPPTTRAPAPGASRDDYLLLSTNAEASVEVIHEHYTTLVRGAQRRLSLDPTDGSARYIIHRAAQAYRNIMSERGLDPTPPEVL